MRRLFPMTDLAQIHLRNGHRRTDWKPTQFLVDGDAKEFYEIYYVDDNKVGFNLIKNAGRIRSFYAVKQIINDINEKGVNTLWSANIDMRSFGWALIPIEDKPRRVELPSIMATLEEREDGLYFICQWLYEGNTSIAIDGYKLDLIEDQNSLFDGVTEEEVTEVFNTFKYDISTQD